MSPSLSPFLFFVEIALLFFDQASNKYEWTGFRSNSRCIVVLPCPATCFCLLYNARTVLLLLAGEVGRNQGSGDIGELRSMRKAMMEAQNQMNSAIDEFAISQTQLESNASCEMTEITIPLKAIQEHGAQIEKFSQVWGVLKKLSLHSRKDLTT